MAEQSPSRDGTWFLYAFFEINWCEIIQYLVDVEEKFEFDAFINSAL